MCLRHSYLIYNGVQHGVTFQIRIWNGYEQFDGNSDKDRKQYRVVFYVADSNVITNEKWDTHGDTYGDTVSNTNKDGDAK